MADLIDLQQMIDTAPTGGVVSFGPGEFYTENPVTVNKIVGIEGRTWRGTKLFTPTMHLTNYASWFRMSDLELIGDGSDSSHGVILGSDDASAVYYPTFENVLFNNHILPLWFRRSCGAMVDRCVLNPLVTGIKIENLNDVDQGDSTIRGTLIDTSSHRAGNAIEQFSSGGLKIEGGKILHFQRALHCEIRGGKTSDLIIDGLSAELQTDWAFYIARQVDSSFKNVMIDAQVAGTAGGVYTEGISNVVVRGIYECSNKDAVVLKNGRMFRVDAQCITTGRGIVANEAVELINTTGSMFDGCSQNELLPGSFVSQPSVSAPTKVFLWWDPTTWF